MAYAHKKAAAKCGSFSFIRNSDYSASGTSSVGA